MSATIIPFAAVRVLLGHHRRMSAEGCAVMVIVVVVVLSRLVILLLLLRPCPLILCLKRDPRAGLCGAAAAGCDPPAGHDAGHQIVELRL